MDAVAVVMMGAGVWVSYSAYKGHDPFTVALGVLTGNAPSVAASVAGTASPQAVANNGTVTPSTTQPGGINANGYSY